MSVLYWAGVDDPTPKATLTGHQNEVTTVAVSAELGIVVSGSQGQYSGQPEATMQLIYSTETFSVQIEHLHKCFIYGHFRLHDQICTYITIVKINTSLNLRLHFL